jgi:hypothetical protein
MTDQQHPIVPSEGLKEQWESEWHHYRGQDTYEEFMARQAAQWGADQELEACCEWIPKMTPWDVEQLRAARRPKPPSLKEQALGAMGRFTVNAHTNADEMNRDFDTIRRALEALPD